MAKSFFSVQVLSAGAQAPAGINILAQDAAGQTALQTAQATAVAAAGKGAQLRNAMELGGGPIAVTIAPAMAPATDGAPKSVFTVQFRAGSGPNGTNLPALIVQSNPQTNGGVTTSAADLAVPAAVAAAPAGAAPIGIQWVGDVDIDATGA